jgi:hypothetical protein
MRFRFDAQHGLIIVHTELAGPSGTAVVRLALDTGCDGDVDQRGSVGCHGL